MPTLKHIYAWDLGAFFVLLHNLSFVNLKLFLKSFLWKIWYVNCHSSVVDDGQEMEKKSKCPIEWIK